MRTPITPPNNTEGTFVAKAPFALTPGIIYHLDAIENFVALKRRGIDVFTEYYSPVGLTMDDYLDDGDAQASILTFKSTDGEIRFVPDTFLESYPGQNTLDYRRNVVVMDLAIVPSNVDLKVLEDDLIALVKANVGVETTVEITNLQYEGTVSEEDHTRMEALRKQNIRLAVPLSEQVADLTARNTALQTYTDQLLEILKANGLAN